MNTRPAGNMGPKAPPILAFPTEVSAPGRPHNGLRHCRQKSTCNMQSTLEPHVEQSGHVTPSIWGGRNPRQLWAQSAPHPRLPHKGLRPQNLIRSSIHDKFSGVMKITTHLYHISHCKTSSGTNWSKRWTHRVFIQILAAIRSVNPSAAAEKTRHIRDSQGQILALSGRSKSSNRFKHLALGSEADLGLQPPA